MAGKLKILEICNQDRFLASPYMLPLLASLVRQGHEVEVACRVTDSAGLLEEAGIKVHDVPFTRSFTLLHDLKTYQRLKALLREGDYDLVHTHTPKDGVLGRRAAWKLKVPAVLHTCNGFYFSDGSSRGKTMAGTAGGEVCRPPLSRPHLRQRRGHGPGAEAGDRAGGMPSLHPQRRGRPPFPPREEPSLREELGIPASARVVGYVGEITAEKNQGTLLRAVSALAGKAR